MRPCDPDQTAGRADVFYAAQISQLVHYPKPSLSWPWVIYAGNSRLDRCWFIKSEGMPGRTRGAVFERKSERALKVAAFSDSSPWTANSINAAAAHRRKLEKSLGGRTVRRRRLGRDPTKRCSPLSPQPDHGQRALHGRGRNPPGRAVFHSFRHGYAERPRNSRSH